MRETPVHFARSELDAETAASALRARGLHPRVVRDDYDAMLGIGGGLSIGRFIVLVPEVEAGTAREVLRPPRRRGARSG